MRVPLRSRSNRRRAERGLRSLRSGRRRAGELLEDAVPAVERGRERAEELAREAAANVPRRERKRRRGRGLLALLLLTVAGVALYLLWQRKDREPARLTFDPPGPDVAPPPAPEPPAEPVSESADEPADAVSEGAGIDEGVADEDKIPEVTPPAVPAIANVEVGAPSVPSVVAQAQLDEPAIADEVDAVAEVEEELFDEAGEPDAEELERTEPVAVDPAEPTADLDEPEDQVEAPELEAPSMPERSQTWFGTTASGTAQADAPEPERSMPLRGASSLPPSSPAGAPFRPAGDRLPNGRSWPTLPK